MQVYGSIGHTDDVQRTLESACLHVAERCFLCACFVNENDDARITYVYMYIHVCILCEYIQDIYVLHSTRNKLQIHNFRHPRPVLWASDHPNNLKLMGSAGH